MRVLKAMRGLQKRQPMRLHAAMRRLHAAIMIRPVRIKRAMSLEVLLGAQTKTSLTTTENSRTPSSLTHPSALTGWRVSCVVLSVAAMPPAACINTTRTALIVRVSPPRRPSSDATSANVAQRI